MVLTQNGLKLPPNCKIRIGRKGTIEYNGNKYEVSKEDIKYGVSLNSFSDKDLEEYLRTEIDIRSDNCRRGVIDLVREGFLDMTIVHSIYATDLSKDQKKQLLQEHINKIQNSKASRNYEGIDVEYDLKDLSKASIWERLRRKEINRKEKAILGEKIFKTERYGIAKATGEYKESWKEKILGIFRRKKAFPIPNRKDMETVAYEYNQMAYDEEGNKVTKKELEDKFKQRLKANKEIVRNNPFDSDKLTKGQKEEIKDLIAEHTDPTTTENEEKESEEERV